MRNLILLFNSICFFFKNVTFKNSWIEDIIQHIRIFNSLIHRYTHIKHKKDIQQYIMSSVIKRIEQRRFFHETKRF